MKRPAKKKKKVSWGVNTILVETIQRKNDTVISWEYESGGGGYILLSTGRDWAEVTTDDHEGSAMFPVALVPLVVKHLRAELHKFNRSASLPKKEGE